MLTIDHQHTLQLNNSATPSIFTCNHCKELGNSERSFICENRNCNHIIHIECALADEHAVHPFFKNSHFKLCENASDGGFCDACGKDLLGYFYWCSKTNYALHPCCLKLEDTISSDGKVIMTLCNHVPSDCAICRQKHVVRNQFQGWSYILHSEGNPCCHVSCFTNLILHIDDKNEETSSKRGMRSVMKFTGKLALGIFQAGIGDLSSIFTIGEAIVSAISSD
ncbi:hypothetical protein TSUD_172100 [Trifolium subterraneum]|uniref:DC1 domain-containing protein n=1 Tax=Trifolium subterraneum TaxID=3900 RepID=A0A2Z6LZI5_TRISU|nr:hypothetical protein TSUD_172100 [Trifolium subterraneum]